MKRFTISLRCVLGIVAGFAVLLAIDQWIASAAREFEASVRACPDEFLPPDEQPNWVGGPNVDSTVDTTTVYDRISLKRRIVVNYTKKIAGHQLSYTVMKCSMTFTVDGFDHDSIEYNEEPTFTFY
ncbi:MAG: hypothetical protein AAFN77_24620 [Planctomycetota bacterium]